MRSYWWADKKEHIILLVIASGSLCLLLANLGNQYLWHDEAQTALISKTVLTGGLPRGYDGKTFFSLEHGADYGPNYIWRWHTWLQFYVLAGFYEVFGVSIFVSRLPFALFGFGTVLLTYFFVRSLWPNTHIPAIAAALLAISVPFLLLSRQCRYYSLVMFFSMLSLYAYVGLLRKRKYSAVLLFVASTLLFHSMHIYIFVLCAALFSHAVIFHRDRLIMLIIVLTAAMLFILPWLILLGGMNYSDWLMPALLKTLFLKLYLEYIISYIFPVWLLVIALVAAGVKFARTGYSLKGRRAFLEKVMLPVFFVIFNVIVVIIISPLFYFRYLAPAIPLLIMLIAVIVNAAAEAHLLLAVATVVILIATSQLKDYIYEITHDYVGPVKCISHYLNEHGRPDDIVAAECWVMSLKFHTNMKILGDFPPEEVELAGNARWIVTSYYGSETRIAKYLTMNIDWNRYRKIELDCSDIPNENREDPKEHLFRTYASEDKVLIYERID